MNSFTRAARRMGSVRGGALRALALLVLLLAIGCVRARAQGGQATPPIVGQVQTQGQTPPSAPPPFKQLRYEEDYSYLQDPSRRASPLDRIKYIPLRAGRADWYLSVGGEARPFYEYFRNEEWGAEPQDASGYLLQRYMIHADMRLGRRVRFFGQIKSGVEAGRVGGPRPPDEDRLDFHQLFGDVSFEFDGDSSLTLRAGRQEMSFGSQRLIGTREGPNVRQSFDGLRATLRAGAWRVNGFVTKPVETDAGIFDDAPDHARTLWGVYAVRPLAFVPRANVDLYYLGYNRTRARFDQGAARELRHTVGARIWNREQSVDYNFELVYQGGSFGRGRIRAWTVASDTGYTFGDARFKPRVGLRANVTSGDDDPSNPDLQTFNPLFPRGAYFGLIAPNGPLNHRDVHPQLDLEITDRVSLTADWMFLWRQSRRDGVYGVPGNLLRTGQLSRARFVGHQPGVEVIWQANRHTSFTLNYARFFAGRFLRETPPGRDITYFAAWMTFKF